MTALLEDWGVRHRVDADRDAMAWMGTPTSVDRCRECAPQTIEQYSAR